MAARPSDFTSDTERMRWVRENPDAPIVCLCDGDGCDMCTRYGTSPAWVVDPERIIRSTSTFPVSTLRHRWNFAYDRR